MNHKIREYASGQKTMEQWCDVDYLRSPNDPPKISSSNLMSCNAYSVACIDLQNSLTNQLSSTKDACIDSYADHILTT